MSKEQIIRNCDRCGNEDVIDCVRGLCPSCIETDERDKEIKKLLKKLQKESDKHYKFIANFIDDYCKIDKDKVEFYKHLNGYLEAEIELEKECNQ